MQKHNFVFDIFGIFMHYMDENIPRFYGTETLPIYAIEIEKKERKGKQG